MTHLRVAVLALVGVYLANSAAVSMAAQPGAGSVRSRFMRELPNVPGKSMIAVEVTLAPGESSAPHRHAKSAFIMAYVLSGSIKNQIEGQAAKVYRAGETWNEVPGAHHVMAINMSQTKPAKLLAVFVVDTTDTELTTFDP